MEYCTIFGRACPLFLVKFKNRTVAASNMPRIPNDENDELDVSRITLHPEDKDSLDKLVKNAGIQVSDSVRERSNTLLSKREACHKKGYHIIEADKPMRSGTSKDMRFCYECEGIFYTADVNYKVIPI